MTLKLIVEVLPEMSRGGVDGEVAVGRRDDAHVDLDRRRSADALELLLLEHAKQLGLEVEPHLGDFVEEQRSAVRPLERAFDPLDRAGERALLVAEQRALDEAFRQRGAVQLDERPVAPLALRVDRCARTAPCPCPISPSSSTVARVGAAVATVCSTRRIGGAVADDLALVAELHHLAPQPLVLAAQAHDLQRLVDRELELLRVGPAW